MTKHRALVISGHAAEYAELLASQALPDLEYRCVENAELDDYAQSCDILFGAPDRLIPLLDHLPNLRWLQSSWAGVTPLIDHSRRDYQLTGVKGIFGTIMAEYTLAWLLAFERRIIDRYHATQWDQTIDGSIQGKTIGVMGTGSIGQAIAEHLQPFGLTVRGLNSTGEAVDGFDQCYSFADRLAFAENLDYLLGLLPQTPATNNAIDAALLARLKHGAILLNAGRGNSLDNEAMLAALASGQLSKAVLDVFDEEPLPENDALWATDNVHITSHTAAPTLSGPIVSVFADNYRRYHAGKPLNHVIDFSKGY